MIISVFTLTDYMPLITTGSDTEKLHIENRRFGMGKRCLNRFISAITSLALLIAVYHCLPNSLLKTNSISALTTISANEHASDEFDKIIENPFNYQDDKEVPYDGTHWVQPKEWNCPTIKPKDYKGGIMLYFDKIGLEPDYANGKVQRVYFSITGATEPVGYIKFHVFYDTRLTVKENSNGEVINTGKALQDFTTGSSMVEEGQLVFYAYSNDTILNNGSIFTIDFIVPENAEQGDVYPIGISYVDDGIAYDTFINSEQNDAGKVQMTYVFTKGIFNGYIKIQGEKKTTTVVTTTVTTTTTSTKNVSHVDHKLGDVNNDGQINAVDASSVLSYYAMISTNRDGGYTEEQRLAADVNNDGQINAVDASCILSYYAYVSTTKEDIMSISDFLKK